ncbi:MAG: hypothetical protein UZ22_OP11002000910 [Microgenomates bacterium OLB23]|nr:MAG: hypothetical protein UZ22_OP11002000910 [Microgenomates bacterium OLB23]
MKEFFEEIWDELTDFIEDFGEMLTNHHSDATKSKEAVIGGVVVKVRPAYIFAERVDHILKLVIGVSVLISTFTASFYGFTSLSDLVKVLITSFVGRGAMFIIGASYVTIATWKLLHIKRDQAR